MKPTTIAKGCSLILASALCPTQSEAVTTIVGDSIDIWGVAQLNAVETYRDTIIVTDPGVEYTAAIVNDIYTLDFGPTSVVLTTINPWYSPWFNSGNPPSALELRGINVPGEPNLIIGSIDVRITDNIVPEENAPANYPDFSANNVTFGDDFLRIETGPYSFPENSTVLISMNFVPEPSTGLLTFAACLPPLLRRQRKSKCPEVMKVIDLAEDPNPQRHPDVQ
jgi:hypothetical protein